MQVHDVQPADAPGVHVAPPIPAYVSPNRGERAAQIAAFVGDKVSEMINLSPASRAAVRALYDEHAGHSSGLNAVADQLFANPK